MKIAIPGKNIILDFPCKSRTLHVGISIDKTRYDRLPVQIDHPHVFPDDFPKLLVGPHLEASVVTDSAAAPASLKRWSTVTVFLR